MGEEGSNAFDAKNRNITSSQSFQTFSIFPIFSGYVNRSTHNIFWFFTLPHHKKKQFTDEMAKLLIRKFPNFGIFLNFAKLQQFRNNSKSECFIEIRQTKFFSLYYANKIRNIKTENEKFPRNFLGRVTWMIWVESTI